MKRMKLAPGFAVPDLTTETLGIIGKRGSGKSHTGTLIVEELLELDSQVIVIDPIGGAWGLRAGANGKKDGGYAIPIFGGLHGDMPLEEKAGALLADYLVENRLSGVLDLSGFSKSAMRRFVRDFAERFYFLKNKRRDPVHVVIDECDLFVPQRVDSQDMMPLVGAINDFVLRGRQRGIGVTLISQRPARIAKDVLTQVEILIAFRLTGPQDIKAFGEWIEHNGTKDEQKEVLASLSSLERGTGWFWAPGVMNGLLRQIEFRERRTFDSSRTPDGRRVKPPKTLKDVDLGELDDAMKAQVERAKAEDPKALRSEVMRLKKELEKKQALPPKIQAAPKPPRLPKRVEVPMLTKRQEARLEKQVNALVRALTSVNEEALHATGIANTALDELKRLRQQMHQLAVGKIAVPKTSVGAVAGSPSPVPAPRRSEVDDALRAGMPRLKAALKAGTKLKEHTIKIEATFDADSEEVKRLGKGERKVMIAVAQYEAEGVTKKQITQMTNYKRSTRDAYLLRLRNAGFTEEGGSGRIRATGEGIAWLGDDYETLPTGDALYKHWLPRLPEGERRILVLAHETYPDDLEKSDLDVQLRESGDAYARSSRDAYILRLKNRRLIEEPSRGSIRMADALADEGEF